MAATVKKTSSKKSKRNVPNGVVHIQSTFNNTIVSITDTSGHVISRNYMPRSVSNRDDSVIKGALNMYYSIGYITFGFL